MEWKKPSWWTQGHDLSWDKVKSSVSAELQKLGGEAQKLEKSVAEAAAALGHGARASYGKLDASLGTWSKDVEAKLKTDWEHTHADGKVAWDKVRDAAKHGWEKAQAAAGKQPPAASPPAAK